MKRLRSWLFNLWLDHWYLPRHPYHGMVVPLAVLYRTVQAAVREALFTRIPELDWLQRVPDEAIQPSGRNNFIVWGRA